MIENRQQYEVTKVELAKFEQELAQLRASAPSARVHTRIHQAMQDAMESEIAELQAQIVLYEEPQTGC